MTGHNSRDALAAPAVMGVIARQTAHQAGKRSPRQLPVSVGNPL